MKVIGIMSSPSANGNTATLVKEALKGAKDNGADVEEISLPEYNLLFCKGCMLCTSKGKCPLDDKLEEVKQKIYQADGLIFGSPTYGLEPNAIMKNFIDRIGTYSVYTSSLGGKYFIGISTAGGFGAKKVAKKLTFISTGIFKRAFISGTLGALIGWNRIENFPLIIKKAYNLGKKIACDIRKKKKYLFQDLFKRLLNYVFLRKVFTKNILNNKDDRMKAIYQNIKDKGFLK